MLAPSPSLLPSPTRAIALLAVAGFASQAMVRAADSLLPQIAANFAVSIGTASIIISGYAMMHGSMQFIVGPVGERFGKYRVIAVTCALSSLIVLACGLAQSLTTLALARIASGATAAWIIPLGMAYIGDVVPYNRRQQVLGRYLSGQVAGQLFGQAAGGIIGDLFGWRAMFFVLSATFALAASALFRELAVNPLTLPLTKPDERSRGFAADYSLVLARPWARIVLLAVAAEAAVMWGAFAYVGADLHLRFHFNFALVGIVVGSFGLGGLIYAFAVKQLVSRCGETGLALHGGFILGFAYLMLAFTSTWWITPIAVILLGFGFYMLHNTLQTNATQMAPRARGTAVALFSAVIYLSQTIGVAVLAPVMDRAGAPPIFLGAAILLPTLGLWLAGRLRNR